MQTTISETTVQHPPILETDFEENIREPEKIKWTRNEYYQMSELGLFNGKRVELLEGEIFVKHSYIRLDDEEIEDMSGMSSQHFSGVNLVAEVLREVFKKNYFVSVQCPINMSDITEPEPDISIIRGEIRDFSKAIPKTAALIVEVADSSLLYDRSKKVSLYAKNAIQDYWILNLKDRRLEVYRRPIEDENAFYGFSYAEILIFTEKDTISPLVMSKVKIKVADLLP